MTAIASATAVMPEWMKESNQQSENDCENPGPTPRKIHGNNGKEKKYGDDAIKGNNSPAVFHEFTCVRPTAGEHSTG